MIMKKSALITALILLTAVTGLFAKDDDKLSSAVRANFVKEFKTASNVHWQIQKDYELATFSLNGQIMTAYYNHDAALVALIHHIPVDHLPIFLMQEIKKSYNDYWVTDLFEAAADGDSHYYVTLENSDQVIKLKSAGSTYWTVEKTRKKS
jgi:hypothetical protein